VQVTFDPKSTAPITLVADKIIPPIQMPADTDQVKRFKIQSRILSEWWGHPIDIGATVLLPRDYASQQGTRFPAVYLQGHFSTAAPGGFGRGGDFDKYWMADGTPQMIYITLQHPSPYYDDSYGVNSENNGPFGDAIIKELIPEIESRFRVVREPWGRFLSGGSTGGWIALAHQVLYPDFYGGTFSLCPDSVDFRAHQIVNIYDDANAYFLEKGWTKIERPNQRRPDGSIQSIVLPEQRARVDERLPQEGVEPAVCRRNRLRAPGAALLGSASAGAAREDCGVRREAAAVLARPYRLARSRAMDAGVDFSPST
jgi:Putative esterase